MAALFEAKTVTLAPSAGFVVKTRIVEGQGDHLYSTKVFLNVCHDAQVPKPPGTFDPDVVFPLIVRNEWEVPIVTSPEKRSTDKKGVPSFVYDCCINSECYRWVQVSQDLRSIVIEWCIEAVELMHGLVLERDYATPKMAAKGELSRTELAEEDLRLGFRAKMDRLKQSETLGLLEELRSDSDGELPDLMDLGGERRRPLIQEIDHMSISDATKTKTKTIESIETSEPKETDVDDVEMDTETEPTATTDGGVVPYELTISTRKSTTHFCLIVDSPQFTPRISLAYSAKHHAVVLRNADPARRLAALDRFDLPLPARFRPYRSFLQQGRLYVFCANSADSAAQIPSP